MSKITGTTNWIINGALIGLSALAFSGIAVAIVNRTRFIRMRRNEISGGFVLGLVGVFIIWMFWKSYDNHKKHCPKHGTVKVMGVDRLNKSK